MGWALHGACTWAAISGLSAATYGMGLFCLAFLARIFLILQCGKGAGAGGHGAWHILFNAPASPPRSKPELITAAERGFCQPIENPKIDGEQPVAVVLTGRTCWKAWLPNAPEEGRFTPAQTPKGAARSHTSHTKN